MSHLLAAYADVMFTDRCDVYARAPGQRGGTRADPELTASSVPCSYQLGYGRGLTQDGSVPAQSQASVFFAADPGRLPSDSQLIVRVKDGDTLDVPVYLNVLQLVSSRLSGFAVFRADCTGRA